MKLVPQYEFSTEQDLSLRRARLLEWISLAYLASVITLMYIVLGESQAMKTAWVEDMLSLIPPACFLTGSYVCWRRPTHRYPYGFHRVVSILFLCAALALLLTGGTLLLDSLKRLAERDHPPIGMKEYFGVDIWLGWWMILALLWGTFPPLLLGHLKIGPAEKLNDKILMTDGKMNKADWMTAVAAIGGVLGIGMGWWWADAVAGAFISFDIMRDGWRQTKDAVTGLINRAPTSVHGDFLPLPDKARAYLESLPWVDKAQVRLCEHGHLIFGEGFVVVRPGEHLSPDRLRAAAEGVEALDWRLQDISIAPLPHDDGQGD
jgi:divalent metal cation (Fe/Co/Zn/Cd) transporter